MNSYARPSTLPEAVALLAQGGWRLMAGGTDLYPATTAQVLGDPMIDIADLADLHGISASEQGLRIGAATRWTQIATATLPPALAALQQAARQVGGWQIQNAGTLGGNLCHASPAADGVPPLLVLDAELELVSARGARRLPLDAFLRGPRQTARQPDEVLCAIHIPASALAGRAAFHKLGARAYLVISIAMVAVRLTMAGGRITQAALAVGACSATARRLPVLEAALIGLTPAQALPVLTPAALAPHLSPLDDIRASADYRLEAAAELLRRAVTEAA